MAITQSALVDVLFKKFIASKSTTDTTYQYFNEAYNSRLNTFSTDIWTLSDLIPNTAAPVSGVVEQVLATMTYVVGSNGAFYDATGKLRDIIPFNYGDGTSYEYQIFQNNGTTVISKGDPDWLLDPNSGVLKFFNGAVLSQITGAAGVIASHAFPPVIRAWKYIGPKGIIPNLSGLSYSGGTLSSPLASLAAGSGLTYSSYTYSILLASMSSGLTFASDGGLKTILSLVTSNGLTYSDVGTLSVVLKATNPGLTFSSEGRLGIVDSLVLTDTNATLGTNILGKYTSDPTQITGWDSLSIPTKGYVDSIASGLSLKQAVRVAATGSVNLTSAPAKIDGITLSYGDRVLLWKQDDTINGTISNGIYAFSASGYPLTRVSDLDGNPSNEVTPGVYTFVTDGQTYIGTGFVVVNVATESVINVGTMPMRWTQFSSAGTYLWGKGLEVNVQTINVDFEPDKGLTFSTQDQLTIELQNNSGLIQGGGGLAVNPNIASYGLTFSNGRIETYKPIVIGPGLTLSSTGSNYESFTYSVNVGPNSGITFSQGGGLILEPGLFGNNSALTYSNNSLYLLTDWGITISTVESGFNIGRIRSSWTAGDGFDIIEIAGGLTYSHKLQPRLDSISGLSFNGATPSELYIDWVSIVGQGLTWSANKLQTVAAGVNKYATSVTFSAGIGQYVTHSLGTTDFVIQMYNNISGDEVLASYTGRTLNDVFVTAYEDVDARIVIIG